MALCRHRKWSDVTHMHPLTPTIVFSEPDIWTEMVINSTITLAWCLPSLLMNANLCSLHTIHHTFLVHNPFIQWHTNTHSVKYLTLIHSTDSKYVSMTGLLRIKLPVFYLISLKIIIFPTKLFIIYLECLFMLLWLCCYHKNNSSSFSFDLISFYSVHLFKST